MATSILRDEQEIIGIKKFPLTLPRVTLDTAPELWWQWAFTAIRACRFWL